MQALLPKRKVETIDHHESHTECLEVTRRLDAVERDVAQLSKDMKQLKHKENN